MAISAILKFLFGSCLIGFMKNDVYGAPVCHRPMFTNPYAIVLDPDQPMYTDNYAQVLLDCEERHTSIGLPTAIYCYPGGTWSDDPTGGRCYAHCNTTELIVDDDIKATNDNGGLQTVFDHGTTATFECTDQGQFSGSLSAACSNGTLDYTSEPTCLAYCPINSEDLGDGLYYDTAHQSPVTNETGTDYYRDGDVITYRCPDGYEDINCTSPDDCTSTCDDGTWDPPNIPTCLPPVCHRPIFTNPYAIVLDPDQSTYTDNYDLLQLDCEEGHTSSGLPTAIYCYPDGSWSDDPTGGICYAQCNTTELIVDDDIKAINYNGGLQTVFDHGTIARFECNDQGQFSGSESATCSNGTLDYSNEPTCLAYCPINSDDLGDGLYYDTAQSPVTNETGTDYYRDGDVITYRCSDGYEDINCTSSDCTSTCDDGTWDPPNIPTCLEIDECDSNPCENNATCADLINEYTCQCVDGFNGTNCEINIDDCVNNDCQNGATCLDEVDSYKCQCPDGYKGTHCEYDIDECSSNPCQNGGTCNDLVNGFNCTCAHGYMGDICDEAQVCHRPMFTNPYAIVLNPDQPTYTNNYDQLLLDCEEGHTSSGLPSAIYCELPAGTWSDDPTGGTCYAQCNTTELISDANIRAHDENGKVKTIFDDGTTAQFECSHQGQFSGSESATCTNGTLDYTTEPTCLASVTCHRPTFTNPYGIILSPDQPTYQVYYPLELTCEKGYTPRGLPSPIYCKPDGTWSNYPTGGLCIAPMSCHRPTFTNPYGIILSPDQPTYQVYYPLELTCEKGYTPRGLPSPIYCNLDGTWSNYPAGGLCIAPVSCHRPTFTNPYGIILSPDQPTYHVYYPLELTCEKGYTPRGLHSPIYCNLDGTWSNYPAGGLCIGDEIKP